TSARSPEAGRCSRGLRRLPEACRQWLDVRRQIGQPGQYGGVRGPQLDHNSLTEAAWAWSGSSVRLNAREREQARDGCDHAPKRAGARGRRATTGRRASPVIADGAKRGRVRHGPPAPPNRSRAAPAGRPEFVNTRPSAGPVIPDGAKRGLVQKAPQAPPNSG